MLTYYKTQCCNTLHLSSRQFINPAENKFSTTEKLTRFDRTKFISAMNKRKTLVINTHCVYSCRCKQTKETRNDRR